MLINTERRQTVHYRADRMAFRVLLCMDGCGTISYDEGTVNFYKSDVLKFLLEDNCSLVVRPSGTEPKLKIYISVSAENKEMAEKVEDEIAKTAEKWIC